MLIAWQKLGQRSTNRHQIIACLKLQLLTVFDLQRRIYVSN